MDTSSNTKPNTKKYRDDGYHIREFDPEARRMANAGASLADVNIGTWIAQAVKEKFTRDVTNNRMGD